MQEQKSVTLKAIFSEVLANLAFMFTDEEDVESSPDDVWLETTISYAGPVSGSLHFRCTKRFAIHLAANLLGVTPTDDDAESKASDAVREFMNIVCGQFITASHGTGDIFNLSIPETRRLPEPPDLVDYEDFDSTTLSVEGHRVQLSYRPDVGDVGV